MPKASALYLGAAALYRIARFLMPRSSKQKEAWIRKKTTFLNRASLLRASYYEVPVPYVHSIAGEGSTTPIHVRVPRHASASSPFSCIIQTFGLHDRRTELTHYADPHTARGSATVGVEIPGTGDCRALANDPIAPERLWTSVLDWTDGEEKIDKGEMVVHSLSTGGYYGMRMAHTHRERLAG